MNCDIMYHSRLCVESYNKISTYSIYNKTDDRLFRIARHVMRLSFVPPKDINHLDTFQDIPNKVIPILLP